MKPMAITDVAGGCAWGSTISACSKWGAPESGHDTQCKAMQLFTCGQSNIVSQAPASVKTKAFTALLIELYSVASAYLTYVLVPRFILTDTCHGKLFVDHSSSYPSFSQL